MVRLTALAFGLLALLAAGALHAANIAVLEPSGSSPSLAEASFRLRGELSALSIEVRVLRRPARRLTPAGDSRAWLERTASELQIDAIIDVLGDNAPRAVDVWIFQRSPRRSHVARVVLEPDVPNAAETLAIRAIEVLRSNFLEIDLAARARRAGTAPESRAGGARTPAKEGVPPRNEGVGQSELDARFGVEAGAGVLTSLDGVGPAILPLVRVGWAARSWLVVQATLSGFGTRPTLGTPTGTAKIAQSYGVLGLCFCSVRAPGLGPFIGLSAGSLHTSLQGEADAPERGHSVEHWSFLVDAGFGARLRLPDRYTLTLAAHVQLAQPRVAVHFIDTPVATTGRPNLLVNLAVGAWL